VPDFKKPLLSMPGEDTAKNQPRTSTPAYGASVSVPSLSGAQVCGTFLPRLRRRGRGARRDDTRGTGQLRRRGRGVMTTVAGLG
jgi:hypothetical protein